MNKQAGEKINREAWRDGAATKTQNISRKACPERRRRGAQAAKGKNPNLACFASWRENDLEHLKRKDNDNCKICASREYSQTQWYRVRIVRPFEKPHGRLPRRLQSGQALKLVEGPVLRAAASIFRADGNSVPLRV